MILPPDSKSAAGPQSETTGEGSSRSGSPVPVATVSGAFTDRPLPYSQVYRNPNGTHEETSPLLDHMYTPAPPYSPTDPTSTPANLNAKTTAIQRTRRRFWLALPIAIVIYIAVLLLAELIVDAIPDYPGDKPRRHPKSPDEQERDDGRPIDCLSFPDSKWAAFDQNGHEGRSYMSQKSKPVYIQTANVDENFMHLVGPGGIADIYVDTYDVYSVYSKGTPAGEDGDVVIMDEEDDEYRAMYDARGMIRVVVEPIIQVLSLDEIPTWENSPGLEMLAASKICVVQKDGSPVHGPPSNGTFPPSPPKPPKPPKAPKIAEQTPTETTPLRHKHRSSSKERESFDDEKRVTSQGLGIYTKRPNRDGHTFDDALRFVVRISLPEEYPPTLMELLLIAMGYNPPRGYVRSFEILAPIANTEINAGQHRMGKFDIKTDIGSITFKKFVAEYVKVYTNGGITGWVDVSSMLEIEAPTGSIELDISLSPAPSVITWPPPGAKPMTVKAGKGCDLPAVYVSTHASSGSTKLSYGHWSQTCRGLKQVIKTDVGSVQVKGHPVYEGEYHLNTNVGSITVEVDENVRDPTQRDRRRTWTMARDDKYGDRCTWGTVGWETDRGPNHFNVTGGGDMGIFDTCPGIIRPGDPRYDPMASTLDVESKVGSIKVIL